MLLIQFTGLSGAGKTTLANKVAEMLDSNGFQVEVIDGDEYQENICGDLGYSNEDRQKSVR